MKHIAFISILSVFTILAIASSDTSSDNNKANATKKESETKESTIEAPKQECVGNQGCITNVRRNFQSSGKQILGEEYLDNGVFGISFLDPSRGEAYNAKVYTDCNCNLTDVSVSVIK